MADPVYPFGEAFLRKVLALAVRTDVVHRAHGAFAARFFGARDGSQRVKPPRQLLAELVERFCQDHPQEYPGQATMDELVAQAASGWRPEVRSVVEAEWRAIRDVPVPDPGYVREQIARWAQLEALAQAFTTGAVLLEQARQRRNGETVTIGTEVRKLLDEALRIGMDPGEGAAASKMAKQLMRDWASGSPQRRLASTGLARLDQALGGGPALGEVYYVLAPPKGAKTTLLLNVGLGAARRRVDVAFFSYEMGLWPMLRRWSRWLANASKQELRLEPHRIEQAMRGWRASGGGEIWFQRFIARKHGCAEAARVIERLRADGQNVRVVVLDYLNIMSPEQREQEKRHELSAISREMKALAAEQNVMVWSAALVNRKAVGKSIVRATDIAECYEVISVLDGAIAICGTEEECKLGKRRLYIAALREEEGDKEAGEYVVDMDRCRFRACKEINGVDDGEV